MRVEGCISLTANSIRPRIGHIAKSRRSPLNPRQSLGHTHLHVFSQNGFEISVEPAAPPTQRLKLLSLPFSKHTVFGASDVHELVALLAEAPGQPCRLPKLRSMFASRACRSAVMIGTPLDMTKMTTLTRQLATLDQPWNCPHGRPTLRHLVDVEQLAATPAAVAFEASRQRRIMPGPSKFFEQTEPTEDREVENLGQY